MGELLRVCFLTLHLCQDGGPDGRGDILIQLVPSFRGIRGGDYATSTATEESQFDSQHGEIFSFPCVLRPAPIAIQQVRGNLSPWQRGPGSEPEYYQLQLGQEVSTVSSCVYSSQCNCRMWAPQAVDALWFKKIFFFSRHESKTDS